MVKLRLAIDTHNQDRCVVGFVLQAGVDFEVIRRPHYICNTLSFYVNSNVTHLTDIEYSCIYMVA